MTRPRKSAISPFRRGRTWWARVPRLGALSVQRSLGTDDRDTARNICAFLWTLKGRRESWLLDELAAARIPVGEAFDAHQNRRLEAFIEERRAGRADPDLAPLVAEWERAMLAKRKPGAATAAKYVRQVRRFMPEGKAFKRSELTRARIATFLHGLGIGQPNRYRAAISRFCRHLVERDVLATNPVRDVEAASERPARCRYLSDAETAAVIGALDEPARTLHALLAGTGMEVSAALRLLRRDLDLEAGTVRAIGTKRATRDRTVRVTEPWALDLLRRRAGSLLPAARVFPPLRSSDVLAALRKACAAVGVDDYRTHDWRHTYAVREIRRGLPLSVVAHQLGHANTIMVQTVYGRFIPNEGDYAPRLLHRNATMPELKGVSGGA